MNLLKSRIIQGTLLLTAAGFITRILGFFYRIFLADKLGAAVLGSYQLIFPIFAICSSIYGAGVQTAISQLIAAEQGKRSKLCSSDSPTAKGLTTFQNTIEQNCRAILLLGCILSFLLAGSLTFWVYTKADWIAARFIMAPECAPYLQIMCMLFPFCGVGACINGYYYGIQNATVPSITQIVEQISRLSFLCCSSSFRAALNITASLRYGESLLVKLSPLSIMCINICISQKRTKQMLCPPFDTAYAIIQFHYFH